MTETDPIYNLARILRSHILNQVIVSVVRADIPSILKERRLSSDDVADLCGIPAEKVHKLLVVISELGIAERLGPDLFRGNEATALLERDSGRLWGQALLAGGLYYDVWSQLDYSLATGESAFEHMHGVTMWEFFGQNPDEAEWFGRTMGAGSRLVSEEILDTGLFDGTLKVVDVGAGDASFLTAALQRYPKLSGIAFDIEAQKSAMESTLVDSGVIDRAEIAVGDMFEGLPRCGDLYVFKGVVHNWPSRKITKLLSQLVSELDPGARVAIIERPLPPAQEINMNRAINSLTMTLLFGAADRTTEEYAALLGEAGLNTSSVCLETSGMSLIVGQKVA